MDTVPLHIDAIAYLRAKALNEATDDPEIEPFKSKYQAREVFQEIRDSIHKCREENEQNVFLR